MSTFYEILIFNGRNGRSKTHIERTRHRALRVYEKLTRRKRIVTFISVQRITAKNVTEEFENATIRLAVK